MPPPLPPISVRISLHSVRGCPCIIPDFFSTLLRKCATLYCGDDLAPTATSFSPLLWYFTPLPAAISRSPCRQHSLTTIARMSSPLTATQSWPLLRLCAALTAKIPLHSMRRCSHRSREDAFANTMTLRYLLLRFCTAFYCEDAPKINAGMPSLLSGGCLLSDCDFYAISYCKDAFAPNVRVPSHPMRGCLRTHCEDAFTPNARVPSHPMRGCLCGQYEDVTR
jgi:hypothetical protein